MSITKTMTAITMTMTHPIEAADIAAGAEVGHLVAEELTAAPVGGATAPQPRDTRNPPMESPENSLVRKGAGQKLTSGTGHHLRIG